MEKVTFKSAHSFFSLTKTFHREEPKKHTKTKDSTVSKLQKFDKKFPGIKSRMKGCKTRIRYYKFFKKASKKQTQKHRAKNNISTITPYF